MQMISNDHPSPYGSLASRMVGGIVCAAFALGTISCSRSARSSARQDAASFEVGLPRDGGGPSASEGEGDSGSDLLPAFAHDGSRTDLLADTGTGLLDDVATIVPPEDGGVRLVDGLSATDDGGYGEGPAQDAGGPVRGSVVAIGRRYGVPGRQVVIGAQKAVTDRAGAFALDEVGEEYDVTVVEPNVDRVSIYYGLTRREPILSHDALYNSLEDKPTEFVAVIGTLTADFSFPVDSSHVISVYLLSDRGQGGVKIGSTAVSVGPEFGPLGVAWNGAASLSGTLVAIGQYTTATALWAKGFLASKPVSLSGGDRSTIDLELAEISIGRISGTIRMYDGQGLSQVHFGYRLDGAMGSIDLGQCKISANYSCDIPVLTELGGSYCLSTGSAYGNAKAIRCGGAIGMTDFSIQVQAPPQFLKPSDGSPITKDSKLSWTTVANAVYLLELSPDSAPGAAPYLQIYTSATQMRWPDLSGIGMEFPVGANYRCKVSALSPYASMDELASSRGLFNEETDRQWADSETISLVLVQ